MNARHLLNCVATVSATLLTSSYALGQVSLTPPNAVSSVAAGVTVVAPPPPGYDPTTASPESNALYAIPPAPDRVSHPKEFNSWLKAVGGKSIRQSPTLTQTNIFNGPVKALGPLTPSETGNSTVTATSGNWSGSSVIGITNPNDIEAIEEEFVVPTAHQAFGACTGGWDYSSVWPGIDGNDSPDVLQGGIEADAYCSGSTLSTFYSAWIEWYPNGSTRVTSPAISPGDLLFVEVWNVSTTVGYVYFKDYSTNVVAEYKLTAPSGTTLHGNSVEWIVERPGVNGTLATLTNYIDVTATHGYAWDYNASTETFYYPHSNPAVGTLEYITMLDNSNNGISSATGWTSETLWFLNFGSSCGLSPATTAGNPC